MTALRPAVFLDRDGTVNVDTEYVAKPENVELIPGAARAIARLNAARVPVVIITNQSGIGRGFYTEEDYRAVKAALDARLAAEGARVDGTWHCPHAPDAGCPCRKPKPKLFRDAAASLGLDLAKSVYIGDRLRDIEPSAMLGGTGILVPSKGTSSEELAAARARFSVATTLDEAVTRALAQVAAPLTRTRGRG